MKVIAFRPSSRLSDGNPFYEREQAEPAPGPRDLLVAVEAVSINPVDTKVRSGAVTVPSSVDVLGWDAAGTVVGVGDKVTRFAPGDPVFYAGTFTRAGANAERHLVDERLVGRMPVSQTFAQAAALPLTALTAWQLLFERLRVPPGKPADAGSLLVIGGAGGVGSMLLQLARRLTGLTVIATASRSESRAWCLRLGAHHVIDHLRPMAEQIAALDIPPVTHIAALTHSGDHWAALAEIIAPHGHIAVIDDHATLDAVPLKAKSVALHWEMVFTRPMFGTADMIAQHRILNEVAALIDAGVLVPTVTQCLTPFGPDALAQGHALVESGQSFGKVVMCR